MYGAGTDANLRVCIVCMPTNSPTPFARLSLQNLPPTHPHPLIPLTHSITNCPPPPRYCYLCGERDGKEVWGPMQKLDDTKNNFERNQVGGCEWKCGRGG